MATIETAQLGEVQYDESEVWSFPAGIPAFERETRFILLEPSRYAPLSFLHSLNTAGLQFVCAPVSALDPAYQYSLSQEESGLLGAETGAPGLLCLAILTFPEEGEPTANLMAPIVLNRARHVGLQSVQTSGPYSYHQPLRPTGGSPPEGAPPCW